jgi:glycosyltransferase involved in cell wall biosynthesis
VVSVYGGFGMRASEEREISTLERKTFNFLSRESYKVLRDSSAITTDNIDEYEYFKKEFPNKPIHLVHLGANFEKFQCGNPDAFRNKYDIRDENIVLNVARIDAQKNQIIIVKAAKEVLNVFPNTKFVFVGPISNQRYYEDLRSAILESGYKDKFLIIFGLKPETKELIDAYSACDVFIIADTFGGPVVVLYEIWAVGKPVISSRIPGDPGIISSGQDGLLFDSSSSSDLANKIIKLLANKGLTKRIGLAGKRNAKNNYTWNAVAKKLGEIYTDIM